MKDFISKYKRQIVGVTLFSILGFFIIKSKLQTDQVSKAPQFVIGKISYAHSAYRGGIDIDYIYWVDSMEYKGAHTCFDVNGKYASEFINKPITVAYSVSHPKYSVLLLLHKDYEKFGVQMADSMRWIYGYIRLININIQC